MKRSDKSRPIELVGLSAVIAAIVGGIAFLVTSDANAAALVSGLAFIVTVLGLAMTVLATTPQLPTRSSNPHDI